MFLPGFSIVYVIFLGTTIKDNYLLFLEKMEHIANSYLEATVKKPRVVSEFKVITEKETC